MNIQDYTTSALQPLETNLLTPTWLDCNPTAATPANQLLYPSSKRRPWDTISVEIADATYGQPMLPPRDLCALGAATTSDISGVSPVGIWQSILFEASPYKRPKPVVAPPLAIELCYVDSSIQVEQVQRQKTIWATFCELVYYASWQAPVDSVDHAVAACANEHLVNLGVRSLATESLLVEERSSAVSMVRARCEISQVPRKESKIVYHKSKRD